MPARQMVEGRLIFQQDAVCRLRRSVGLLGSPPVCVGTFVGFCQMNRRMWSNGRPGCALCRLFRSCARYVRAVALVPHYGDCTLNVEALLRLSTRAVFFELHQMQPVVF